MTDDIPVIASGQNAPLVGILIGRNKEPSQILFSAQDGRFPLPIDLNAVPQGGGIVLALPGQTWSVQARCRDSNPSSTANMSDWTSVTIL